VLKEDFNAGEITMTWKDTIKKALNLVRSLRVASLDVIEDAIDELAKRPECIKQAKAESERLKEYIDPEYLAMEVLVAEISEMIQTRIDDDAQSRAEFEGDY
tara:strand:+ start:235 stop:540 length:306 start_codon:yes stop_codon:yes gene_type:complete